MRALAVVPSFLIASFCSSLAFAAPPNASGLDDDDAEQGGERIYGGFNSETCAWPTTVFLGGCTGTLVHPEVVIYAAHCGAGQNEVILGEDGGANAARRISTEYCRTNPAYGGGTPGTDHAFCKLATPVTDVPITPILMGCETGVLVSGRDVTVVGFGQADIQPDYGTKSEVWTTLNGVANNEANVGGNGQDACFGDSGGPVYVKLPSSEGADDTWRVFGITSYGATDCLGPSFYSMMHVGMPWIEGELAAEGIDLTPCHNSAGDWEPTPQCQGFPLEPDVPHGTWADGCSVGAPRGGVSEICGAGFEPELDPPTVSLTAPMTGTRYDTMGNPTVSVIFTAEAMDTGSGIQDVRMQLDGADLPGGLDNVEPYEWNLALPPGAYTFNVVAKDWSNNETVSNYVTVGIDQDPPEPPAMTTGEETDGGGEVGTGETGAEGGDTGGLDDPKGCGCTTGTGTPGTGALALLALVAFRRRRD
jgi:uncharacterized protein (TIGR03382 family)